MRTRCLILGLALLGAFSPARRLLAQAIDPTFTRITTYQPSTIYDSALQPDGKLLVLGLFSRVDGDDNVAGLVRFNVDGSIDQAFAAAMRAGGAASSAYYYQHLALQPDGKILLAYNGNPQQAGYLKRINADGSPDNTFTPGTILRGTGSSLELTDLVLQPDGKILLGGNFGTYNGTAAAGLVRLLPTGARDASFDVQTGFNVGALNNTGLAGRGVRFLRLQPDGNILAGGTFTTYQGVGRPGLARLLPSGQPDASFLVSGINSPTLAGLVLQPDGKIVLAGSIPHTGQGTHALTRLLPTGALDASFQRPGLFFGPIIGTFPVYENTLVLQPDGKLLVVGDFDTQPNFGREGMVRLNADGTRDASFSSGRGFLTMPGGRSAPLTVSLQPDGRILTGGLFTRYDGRYGNFVRLHPDGRQDTTFVHRLHEPGQVRAYARQPDGKLLLAGQFAEVNGTAVSGVARLLPDGQVDPTWRTPGLDGRPDALALQPSGKVVVIGAVADPRDAGRQHFVRFNADGSADASFQRTTGGSRVWALPGGQLLVAGSGNFNKIGVDGQSVSSFPNLLPTGGEVQAVALQADGRLLIGGAFTGLGGQPAGGLARVDANGVLDAAYTQAARVSAGSSPGEVRALALQPDGKLVVGGLFTSIGGATRNALARLLPTGQADASFAPLAAATAYTRLNAVAVQPNGRILYTGQYPYDSLFRVLADGQPDISFVNPLTQVNGTMLGLDVLPSGQLMAIGSFTQVNYLQRHGLVRLNAANVLALAPRQVAAAAQAWPVPAHDVLHLELDPTARPRQVQLLDATGRVVLTRPVTAPQLTLPVQALPAGTYLLRTEYAAGPVVQRLLIQ